MSVGLYVARIAAEVLGKNEAAARAYREFPDVSMHWCMVDLVGSSNYRLSQGPEKGYIRGESFFSLVETATRPYGDIRLFKEIGDAALLCSGSLRPLLEACVLMKLSAKQLAPLSPSAEYPFDIRMGIDFGIAKKLARPNEDYLGESIDRLARIMSVRSERSNLLIGEKAYKHSEAVLTNEYAGLCSVSSPLLLQLPEGKQLAESVIYREIYVPDDEAPTFTDFFTEWKKPTGHRS